MKITSWKRAILMGIIAAITSVVVCIAFTYSLVYAGKLSYVESMYISAWMPSSPQKIINIFIMVLPARELLATIVSALISISILRYNNKKFLLGYIPVSITAYVLFQFAVMFISKGSISPINSLSYDWSTLANFPIGAAIGTTISIVINEVRNRKVR